MAKKKKSYKRTCQTDKGKTTGIRTDSGSLSCALPEEFLRTMRELLGEEFGEFVEGSAEIRHYGLRVNSLKISPREFCRRTDFDLEEIPWIRGGYYYGPGVSPAKVPDYAAGLYYLQEPSAMTPASRLPVSPGHRVLDLCAAPGGKATALAAALKGEGLLVANDINRARARALLHNLELFGVPNAVVCSEKPHRLADRFPEYFDRIMVDAPCSGEGMFRKNPAVISSWKEKGPDYFSKIQKEILLKAADMLKPGGLIMYSTCTFSPTENEAVVSELLSARPQMNLLPMEDYRGFGPGVLSFRGESYDKQLSLARRIWPHRMGGEGHFMALLIKEGRDGPGEGRETLKRKTALTPSSWWESLPGPDSDQIKSMGEFFKNVFLDIEADRVELKNNKLYYLPEDAPDMKGIYCLRKGLYLGELKKKRFEPAQTLALALDQSQYSDKHCINIPAGDPRLVCYLRGESIPVPAENGPGEDGWYLLLTDGYPLGFAKLTGGILKNKYPASWRWNG